MLVKEIHVLPACDSQALDAMIARCSHAAEAGNDPESRAYLSGIFEVLAAEQNARLALPISA